MSMLEDKGPKYDKDEDKCSPKSNSGKRDSVREIKSIKSRIPVLKLKKEKVSNQTRFTGDGVGFKAKLIGVEEIDQARGDKLCQETLQGLKQVVKTSGTHKQRINLSISLSGVKLLEEKTGVILYHHAVHQISFISQDIADDRAFGYICSPTPSIFHFVGIKTEKSASLIVLTLRDLFQAVLELKKKQKLKTQPSKETDVNDSSEEIVSTCPDSSSLEGSTTTENQPETEQAEEALYAEVGQFTPQSSQNEVQGNEDVLKTANDLLCGDLLDLTIPMEAIFLNQSALFKSESSEKEEIPTENVKTETLNTSYQASYDKYSVFEEIDKVPSIFENPVIDQSNNCKVSSSPVSSSKLILSDVFCTNGPSDSQEIDTFNPLLPLTTPNFAELDPLAKDHPFIDRKVFFHEIKNPPRKNMKDMMSRNSSFDSTVISQSPLPAGVGEEPLYAKILKIKRVDGKN